MLVSSGYIYIYIYTYIYTYIYIYISTNLKEKKPGRLGLCLCSAEYVKQMVRMYNVINLAVPQKVWRISHTLHQPTALKIGFNQRTWLELCVRKMVTI